MRCILKVWFTQDAHVTHGLNHVGLLIQASQFVLYNSRVVVKFRQRSHLIILSVTCNILQIFKCMRAVFMS